MTNFHERMATLGGEDVDWYELYVQTEQRSYDAHLAETWRRQGAEPYEIVIETPNSAVTNTLIRQDLEPYEIRIETMLAAYRACTKAAISTISPLWKNAASLYVHPDDVRLAVEALNKAGFATDEDACHECGCFDDDDNSECGCDCHMPDGEIWTGVGWYSGRN